MRTGIGKTSYLLPIFSSISKYDVVILTMDDLVYDTFQNMDKFYDCNNV
jgi:hypothetical protein